MLRSRIIPCLLIKDNGLVKTKKFSNPRYVGDPINAVRIFNEKKVDELIVLDIDASIRSSEPNYKLISYLANECRMPLCYGGGVTNQQQIEKIVSLGVEKVALGKTAVINPEVIRNSIKRIGSQSIVVVIDIKKSGIFNNYQVCIENGKNIQKIDPILFAREMAEIGVGELVLNFIDNDGMRNGYNIDLIEKIFYQVNIPVTVIGGAGNLEDVKMLCSRFKIIGAGAGSLFVFKGSLQAVLINYPDLEKKRSLV